MSKNDSPFEIITEPEEQEVSEQKPNLLTRITESFRISNID